MLQELSIEKRIERLEILNVLLSKPDDFIKSNISENKLIEVLNEVFPEKNWEYFNESEFKDNILENISRDYLYLFVGVSKPLASPYMSSYYRANSRLMDMPAREILALMKKWGIEKDSEYKDLPDHFLTIINLMSVLLSSSLELEEELLIDDINDDIRELAGKTYDYLPKVIEKVVEHERANYYSVFLQLLMDEMENLKEYEIK